jgi:hypothetical protein
MDRVESRGWAREEFGEARLGDSRRTERLVAMAGAAHRRPAGRVLEVFQSSAERQGAYDFLANGVIAASAVTETLGVSTAQRCAALPYVYVSVDGSSLSLTDRTGRKGFGAVGATGRGGRGLKVVTSLAIEPGGAVVGVVDQQWWARTPRKKRRDCHRRPVQDKETRHWLQSQTDSLQRLQQHAGDTRVWFLLDRENDRRLSLEALRDSGQTYVVRSSSNRRLVTEHPQYLLDTLGKAAPSHGYVLDVKAGPKRKARKARMQVRSVRIRIRMRDRITDRKIPMEVTVVQTREQGTTPRGEQPICWRLLTNHPVATAADADRVIHAYAQRWAIEAFHKTWKTGACNVEDSQLRDRDHVLKWATIMAAVAARIERLKALSRQQPDLPADRELTSHELAALIMLKRKYKKRTETIPDSVPSLAQAVYWLAELGGYTGKSSGGPPGSITIRRGLQYIAPAAALLDALKKQGKLR